MFCINCSNNRDNCLMLSNGIFIQAGNFAISEGTVFVIGKQLIPTEDVYYNPCKPEMFHIYVVKKDNDLKSWMVQSINIKLCKIIYKDKLYVFPVSHTYN